MVIKTVASRQSNCLRTVTKTFLKEVPQEIMGVNTGNRQ
jgi:hypothetical protein